jgi:predicted  nucleic acid-binding Zn-ribbon protein
MNKYLEQLIKLQKVDIELDSFEPKIKEARASLDQILDEHQNIKKEIELTKEDIADLDLKKRKNELHLQELSDKLKDISSKNTKISSEKELKALQLEEDIAKEQVNFANEEIGRFDKLKANKESKIEELANKLQELETQSVEAQKESASLIESIDKQRLDVYNKKQELLSTMTQNIIAFYEKIRRWAKNTTVVAVKKQACYGCYMRLNDHTYSEVLRAEDITTCSHCGRILYKELQEETQEA